MQWLKDELKSASKRVINGRIYDPSTATLVDYDTDNGGANGGDGLFVKRTGEMFIVKWYRGGDSFIYANEMMLEDLHRFSGIPENAVKFHGFKE